MGRMNQLAESGDYSTGGNFLPRVDCSLVVQLVDLKYKEKAGKKQRPAYFAKVLVLESDAEKVVVGRKYDLMLSLEGAHDSGLKRLIAFIAAFAGFEPGAAFNAEIYADDEGGGQWPKLSNEGALEERGLLAAMVRSVDTYKAAVLKDGVAVAEEREGTNDKFFPYAGEA